MSLSIPSTASTSLPPLSRAQRIARAKAILQATVLENRWIPASIKNGLTVKQAEFLCYEGREALYGGAAGGGKSVALLVAGIQYIDEPGYNALILRRTYKQLAKADSILNKSREWLAGSKARWNGDEKKWTFPNGSTLEFGHMEHENSVYDYQGGAWAFVGVDEATQFTEQMLAYPRSRQRRPAGSKIPIRWRGGSNPGGIGHDHIKARYVEPFKQGKQSPNRQFFPATLADNPNLDQDEYIQTLKESGIDGVILDQLLKGDWDAVPGGRFKKEWFRYYHKFGDVFILNPSYLRARTEGAERNVNPKHLPRFLTIDTAASEKTTADWTVISAWAKFGAELLWLGCHRFKKEIPDIVPEIQKAWLKYKPQFARIEAVAAQRGVLQLAQRAVDPAMIVKAGQPRVGGVISDKLVHATPAIGFVSAGRLWLPADNPEFPLGDVESELIRFTGDEKLDANDDIVDTLSYAVNEVISGPTDAQKRAAPTTWGGGR